MAREGLTESVIIRRGALQSRLNEAAMGEAIPIHFGKKLHAIETTDGREVVATFEDGSTAHGDFLIGADGIHSRVRAHFSPNAPAPSYTSLVSTRRAVQTRLKVSNSYVVSFEVKTKLWGRLILSNTLFSIGPHPRVQATCT
jgi:2-polyprenyl-6-methoxyphenol hydroxylase-like FAD-dependent oxidoreductase